MDLPIAAIQNRRGRPDLNEALTVAGITVPPSRMPEIMLLPSMACPAECIYCFGSMAAPVMAESVIDATLDWISELRSPGDSEPLRVSLHGGEALAAGFSTIKRILEGLESRVGDRSRIQWALQSNLWLVDDEMASLLARHGVSVGTSLDGPEAINDRQRGHGYFSRTMRGVEVLRKHGIAASCIATISPWSLSRWEEVFEFFKNASIDFAIHPSVQSMGRLHPHAIDPDDYGGFLIRLLDRYKYHSHEIRIPTLDRMLKTVESRQASECIHRDCLGMFLAVDPQGDIYSCQRFAGQHQYAMGNVLDKPSLQDLMTSPAAVFLGKWQHARDGVCAGCSEREVCRGGCPYQALTCSPAVDSADPYCKAYRRIFAHIRKSINEEIASPENLEAVAEYPWDGSGNPLLGRGPLIDLVRDGPHPKEVYRNCQTILTAHAMGKTADGQLAAKALLLSGVFPEEEIALEHIQRVRSGMKKESLLPNSLYLHLTWSCGLKCDHCYAVSPEQTCGDHMDAGTLAGILKQPEVNRFRQIVITGGEPLEHPMVSSMLETLERSRAGCRSARWILRSNFALSMDDSILERVLRLFDEVVVSLDGPEDLHDARRGKGSFKRTVGNLERFQSLRSGKHVSRNNGDVLARISLACTQTAGVLEGDAAVHIKEIARTLGIQKIRFRPVLPLGRGRALPVEHYEAIQGVVFEQPGALLRRRLFPVMTCGLGQNLSIDPNGDVYPCHATRTSGHYLGNIHKYSDGLAGLIVSAGFPSGSRGCVDRHPVCAPCQYRYLCGGMCMAWEQEGQYPFADGEYCGRLYQYYGKVIALAMDWIIGHRSVPK